MISEKNAMRLAVLSEMQRVVFNNAKQQNLAQAGKLTEEVGEVWQEILAYHKCLNASKSGKGTKESIREELVDVLTNVLDLLHTFGGDDKRKEFKEINEIIDKKMKKWSDKFDSVTAELLVDEHEYFMYITHSAEEETEKETLFVECFRPNSSDKLNDNRYQLSENFVPLDFYEAVVNPLGRTTSQRERYSLIPQKTKPPAVLDYKEVEEFLAKLNHALYKNPDFVETGLQVYLPFERHLKGNVTNVSDVWSQEFFQNKKEKDNTNVTAKVILVLAYPDVRLLG